MHVVEPKVFVFADMHMNDKTREYLDALGAIEWSHGHLVQSDNEYLVEIAGRTCYKSFGTELNKNLTKVRDDHANYIRNILDTHHGSVLEHATTTVGFVDVSRVLTHELVRHRAGCAYSQESGRFVRLDDIGMYIPECIKADPVALDLFKSAVSSAEDYYNKLVQHMIVNQDQNMPFSKKKEITSALRRIAPEGRCNNIVCTANHRAWRNMITQRTAEGAEEEIRKTFHLLAIEFYQAYPAIYQDMFFDPHPTDGWRTPVSFDNTKI